MCCASVESPIKVFCYIYTCTCTCGLCKTFVPVNDLSVVAYLMVSVDGIVDMEAATLYKTLE